MDNSGRVEVLLGCGHTLYFSKVGQAPARGELVWCTTCKTEQRRRYEPSGDGQWRWQCIQEQCHAGKHTGKSPQLSGYQGSRHIRKYPAHMVHIIAPAGNVIFAFGRDPYALTLDQGSDVPF